MNMNDSGRIIYFPLSIDGVTYTLTPHPIVIISGG